jgi:hypothetical protein
MVGFNRITVIQIGDSTYDFQHPVIRACTQTQTLDRGFQQRHIAVREFAIVFNLPVIEPGIVLASLNLPGTGRLNPPAHNRRNFPLARFFSNCSRGNAGTSICISIRSSNGPETRARYFWIWSMVHRQRPLSSPAYPQGHGFIAATS